MIGAAEIDGLEGDALSAVVDGRAKGDVANGWRAGKLDGVRLRIVVEDQEDGVVPVVARVGDRGDGVGGGGRNDRVGD
jgi:hypothetical protein